MRGYLMKSGVVSPGAMVVEMEGNGQIHDTHTQTHTHTLTHIQINALAVQLIRSNNLDIRKRKGRY